MGSTHPKHYFWSQADDNDAARYHTVYTLPPSEEEKSAQFRAGVLAAMEERNAARVEKWSDLFSKYGWNFADFVSLEYEYHLSAPLVKIDKKLRDDAQFSDFAATRYPDEVDGSLTDEAQNVIFHLELKGEIHRSLTISRNEFEALRDDVESKVRSQSTFFAIEREKDKDLRKFLLRSSGPLSVAGPSSGHGIDELISRAYLRAPWLSHAIDRIWKLLKADTSHGFSMPPVLFWGPGGTGKTMLAKILGETSNVPCFEMDASSGSAAFRIAGMESGWSSSAIGEPFRFIAETGCPNPIIILNELDKATSGLSSNSAPSTSLINALLPMLDPNSAGAFRCPKTGLALDLSRINWVFTSNSIDGLSQPFLSRLEVINIPALTLDQYFLAIDTMCPDDDLLRSHLKDFARQNAHRDVLTLRLLSRMAQRLRHPTATVWLN